MLKRGRTGLLVAAGLVLMAASAQAQSKQWNVCGGSTFYTCASVYLNVSGSSVTVQVWNLSGFYGSMDGTVLNGLGFQNVGEAQGVAGSLSMSGPVRSGDAPETWLLRNSDQLPGGIDLDLLTTTGTGGDNGIANECGNGLPSGYDFWQNPCTTPSAVGGPGWVVLQFNVSGAWNVATTELLVKGRNPVEGELTECWTGTNCSVVPEPVTIALLGTGLAGMGGVGVLRRRREDDDLE